MGLHYSLNNFIIFDKEHENTTSGGTGAMWEWAITSQDDGGGAIQLWYRRLYWY